MGLPRLLRCLALASLVAACSQTTDGGDEAAGKLDDAPPTNSAPERDSVRILVGGDVIPHRPVLAKPDQIRRALSPLSELFRGADVSIVNFESTVGRPVVGPAGETQLAVDAKWLDALHDNHVSAVTIANNHACDLGSPGLRATIDAAHEAKLVGIGADNEDPWGPRTLAVRGSFRVCAVAWTTFVNADTSACANTTRLAVAAEDETGSAKVAAAIDGARRRGCDAIVAIYHGGREYRSPRSSTLSLAYAAARHGADAVLVHHPHVPADIVVARAHDGRKIPIFTSLGNLVSNQGGSWRVGYPPSSGDRREVSLNAWTRLGIIADLEWELPREVGAARRELTWGFHLAWTDNQHAVDREVAIPTIRARLFEQKADQAIIESLRKDAGGPVSLFEHACWLGSTQKRCR